MELISVNIGQERPIQNAKKIGKTGIYKQPVSEPVQITKNGLPTDAICDIENHGGVDQAVYVFGAPDSRGGQKIWALNLRSVLLAKI